MLSFFGNSETGKIARAINWSAHPLGPSEKWDQVLKLTLSIVMNSRFPMFIAWGKDRFLFYNDAYAAILGKKHPAAFGDTFRNVWSDIWTDIEPLILAVDRGEAVYLEDLKLIMNRKGFFEETYFTFSYSPIFSENNEVRGLYCAVVETTQKFIAERNLQDNQDLLKYALESSNMGTWKLDLISGKVFLSEEAAKIFGYALEYDNAEAAIENFILPEFRQHAKDVLAKALADGGAYNDQYQILRPEGEIRWINARGKVRSVNDKPILMTGVILDITELKKVQEALEESVHVRDEFISIASHELRTPLTSLILQNQLLNRTIAKDPHHPVPLEKLQTPLRVFQNQLGHLTHLIEDMLDVSKIMAGKMTLTIESVNLTDLINIILQRWEEEFAQKGIVLQTELEENIIVMADIYKLDQVITNLISNALKYGDGKPIRIEAKKTDEFAVIKVIDQGIGISPDQQSKIFNRFERVVSANNISGLGLGLYISKQIVDSLGGTISIESDLGKGSTFIVTLPNNQ